MLHIQEKPEKRLKEKDNPFKLIIKKKMYTIAPGERSIENNHIFNIKKTKILR